MDYKRFLRQFNSRVVVNADTEEECMNYLEQFTDGEAHRVVCWFGHLDNGYHAALRELDLRYGHPRVIVSSFIRKALEWQPIRADDPKGLNEFSIFLSECLYAVKSVNTGGTLDSLEDLKRLISKLPFNMHDRWKNRVLGSSTYRHPDSEQFVAFVREEARKSNDPAFGREAISKYTTDQRDKQQGKPKVKASYAVMAEKEDERSDSTVSITNAATSQTGTGKSIDKKDVRVPETAQGGEMKRTDRCTHCSSSGHLLDAYLPFSKLPILDKVAFLRVRGMCFGCLERGHMKIECTKRKRCDKCHRRHPTVLHDDDDDYPQTNSTEIKETIISSASVDHPEDDLDGESTMAIIPVKVRERNSTREIVTYAFLDPGSTASFITDDLMTNLGCEGKKMKIMLETLGQTHSTYTHAVKGLEVVGLEGSSVIEISHVYSRKDLPVSARHIPTQKDIDKWRHLDGIQLPKADCDIGLLIGNNVPDVYTPLQVRTGPIGSPHATLSRIGWIPWNVVRDGPGVTKTAVATSCFTNVITEKLKSLETLVRDFPERALPFRNENIHLPDNTEQGQNGLRSLKRSLIEDKSKMSEYKQVMDKVSRMGNAVEERDKELHRTDGKTKDIVEPCQKDEKVEQDTDSCINADRELRSEIEIWNKTKISDNLSEREIEWQFNPPSASQFGGVCEHMSHPTPEIMYSLNKEEPHKLDDESLQTLLCEVESILNSRTITNDPNDLQAFAPNHLILGRQGEMTPPGVFNEQDTYSRRCCQHVQYVADMACQNDIYSTHKISCNFQNIVQLFKIYHATFKISFNFLKYIMQLSK